MELKLPRLPRMVAVTDKMGVPLQSFQQWWQKVVEAIETAFNALQDTVDAIAAAQAAADAANAAADAATAAAATAQTAADDVTAQSNLTSSYPSGVTVSATDAGANASISISAHTRTYTDGSTVSVSAGNVAGLAYSTLYFIYYDDPARAGGAVTYAATTSETTAAQTGDRHLVGSVTTPAALGAPASGDYVRPPGVGAIP